MSVRSRTAFCTTLLFLASVGTLPLLWAANAEAEPTREDGVQEIVDESRRRLGIPEEVRATVVEGHRFVVSVEPQEDATGAYLLRMDSAFLETLEDDELRAAVAHELGHVWIFTHHPYLQTERLANEIGGRIVARDSLKRLYDKLWRHQRTTGDL